MPTLRQATLLTLPDGTYPDGNNLYFRVRNQGRTREFLYRCTIKGKPTFRSLGSIKKIPTLKEARQRAKEYIPEESVTKILFKDAYEKALPHLLLHKQWKSPDAPKRFSQYIHNYWMPPFANVYVHLITTEDIASTIKDAWLTKTPSAKLALGFLRALFKVFVILGYCESNPAIWENKLEGILPPFTRVHRQEHMPYISAREARDLITRLLAPRNYRVGTRVYLLIFVILSALRVGEALSLQWSFIKESDDLGKYFDIPAELRKGRVNSNHLLPITKEMGYLLSKIPKDSKYIFSSYKTHRPINRTCATKIFSELDIPCSFHGFRSTFRVWAAENSLDHDASEFILSHEIGTKVTRSYYRTDLYHKRKEILTQWNKYLFSLINTEV